MVFISWQPYCSRSDNFAREFNGKSIMIYYGFLGSNYFTIAFKYILQIVKTLSMLLHLKPDVVFVMSPPVFACIPVFIYCKLCKKKFIIDAHTGAFTNPIWQKVMWLQKYFSKNAIVNIITNKGLIKYIMKWGAPFTIIPDVPIVAKTYAIPKLKTGSNVTFINTFAKDEPLEEFLRAAKKMGGINFYITGKIKRSDGKYIKMAPENVEFTDYLDNEAYFGLLIASDLIVVLTKLDNTMQRGAYEAIYNGKPIVTSNWKVLRENFGGAAVFVDNDAEAIYLGIKSALNRIEVLQSNAIQLKKDKLKRWRANKILLNSYLNV